MGIQVAMNTYLRQHPDHPKSRGGSLDLSQLFASDEQSANMYNFSNDIHLPPDIDHHQNGSRNEYNYAQTNNAMNNGNYQSDEYGAYHMNGGQHHRRLDTEQKILVATQLSSQQNEFDQQLDGYRKEIESLKSELKEKEEENERLKIENKSLATQSREIQNDWDRMSGYMTSILTEVQYIEEQRNNGQEITTPTPKLHNIFEAIQNTLSQDARQKNIYQNVA